MALEGALKLKEISYIHAEGYPAAEMKHGPIALIDKDMPTVFIAPKDKTYEKIISNIQEIKSRKGKIIVITDSKNDKVLKELANDLIVVPKTNHYAFVILASIVLQLLAYHIALGKKLNVDQPRNLAKSVNTIKSIFKQENDIKKIAMKYKKANDFLYLGRGLNFPVALEGALKLKEISYIHAEGYPAAEMKHGPIALIDKDMPSVFIAPKDKTYEKIISNIQEIKSRKGKIIVITDSQNDKVLKELANDLIVVPKTNHYAFVILASIVLQLLAYHIALGKKLNVDQPRNLAKSVSVE